jgi:hypothetical protein
MIVLRMVSLLVLIAVLPFSSAPNKNKNEKKFFSKEEMTGKWNSIITSAGSSIEIKIELKNSGEFKIEKIPFDGIPEFTGTWELEGNNFTAKTPFTCNEELVLFEGKVDFPKLVIKPYKVSRKMAQLTRDSSPPPCL